MRPTVVAKFLRWFFRHLYTTFAWAYDWVAWVSSSGQWEQWQSTALHNLPPGATLELGHGPGHLLEKLARRTDPFVGIDPSRQMSQLAARRLRRRQAPLNLARARAQELPFPAQTFSTVIATFPSEFIVASGTLEEISRILRTGGSLIIVGVARITGRSLPDRFSAWLYRLTGQSQEPSDAWLAPFTTAGLDARFRELHLERAVVVQVLAVKAR